MEYNNQNLTKRVMRRVYAVWFMRKMAPVAVGMPLSSGFALWFTAKEFFVAKIIENLISSFHSQSGFFGVLNYVGSALSSAPLLPLAAIGFSAGLFLALAYKLVRNFSQVSLVRI